MHRSSSVRFDRPDEPPGASPRENDIVIVVMGMTGSGKSSFIAQFDTDREVGIGRSLESFTTQIELYSCNDAQLGRFWLVDTPGFSDTKMSDAEVLERIAFWLNRAYRQRIQLTGVLYLHSIEENRVQGSMARSFTWFSQICGESAFRKVLLVTTRWDLVPGRLTAGDAVGRETELKRAEYWGDMIRMGASTARHHNNIGSARTIIEKVIANRRPGDTGTHLQFQREVGEGRRLNETTVGSNINMYQQQQQSSLEIDMQRLERELRDQMQQLDERTRRDIEEQWRRFEAKRNHLRQEQDRLRATIDTLNQRFDRLEREENERQNTELRQLEAQHQQLRLAEEIRHLDRRREEIRNNERIRVGLEERMRRQLQIRHNFWCILRCICHERR